MSVTGGVPNEIARYSSLLKAPGDRLTEMLQTLAGAIDSAGDFYGSDDPLGKAFEASFKPAIEGLREGTEYVRDGMYSIADITIGIAQNLYNTEQHNLEEASHLNSPVPPGGKEPKSAPPNGRGA